MPWLLDSYGGARPRVLQAVLAHAVALGARSAVIEYRYLDPDWRNEHRDFYASTFRRYPSVAHRLHFFEEPPDADWISSERPATIQGLTYLGYCVLRPVPAAPVGRTMLRPLQSADLTCVARDRVNLFGTELTVDGAPFIAQDAQLSRCAQTTTWVTAYYHHLKFRGPRVLPGAIAAAVANTLEHGRQLPSPGLTIGQMADAARSIGLPPLVYPLRNLAEGESVPTMVCRYLNSGIPVTIATRAHAFVLVGYSRSADADGKKLIHFLRHDDETGPYQRVEHWLLDEHGPWEYAIVPLPAKVYLPGENAEAIGGQRLRDELDRTRTDEAAQLLARLDDPDHPLSFRSTVVLSNEFKNTLTARLYPADVAAAYQRMQMSRFVWVVELTDRNLRDARQPCVLAEAVIDATDHIRDLHVLGWRVPGAVWGWLPDEDRQTVRRNLAPVPLTISIAQPHVVHPPVSPG
ncbi:MAG TPA: hypothetical protein VGL75_03265 [Acidothermaceae bacterium]